jgi:hypothetical protein
MRSFELVHRHLLEAAIAALVLGLLLGVGVWQTLGRNPAEEPVPTVALARTTEPAEVPIRVYIVVDEAQKEKVLLAEDDAASVRFASGELEANADFDIVVAANNPGLDALLLDLANANDIRIQQGLAPMSVIDLR